MQNPLHPNQYELWVESMLGCIYAQQGKQDARASESRREREQAGSHGKGADLVYPELCGSCLTRWVL